MNDPLKTTPVLEINFEAYFSKANIVVILTSFQSYGCTFYHLSDKEKDPTAKTEITIDIAAEYLSNPLNRNPNILGILCKYNSVSFIVYHIQPSCTGYFFGNGSFSSIIFISKALFGK